MRLWKEHIYGVLGLEFLDPCFPLFLTVRQMFLHASPRAVLIHFLNGLKKPFMLFDDGVNVSFASDSLRRHPVKVPCNI
jgi:hypothetical protein